VRLGAGGGGAKLASTTFEAEATAEWFAAVRAALVVE
jgi:hypothetical protein